VTQSRRFLDRTRNVGYTFLSQHHYSWASD
jgi:hypothetical protein